MPETFRDPNAPIDARVADLMERMSLEEKVAQLGSMWLTVLVKDEHFDEDRVAAKLANGIGQVTRIGASTGLFGRTSRAALANGIQQVLVERTRLGIPCVIHEEARGRLPASRRDGLSAGPRARCDLRPRRSMQAKSARRDPHSRCARSVRSPQPGAGARRGARSTLGAGARRPTASRPSSARSMGVAYVRGGAVGRPPRRRRLHRQALPRLRALAGWAQPCAGAARATESCVRCTPSPSPPRSARPGLASIMNSYSSIDGEPVAASRAILTDLLRGELGFDGTVVADYFAVDPAAAQPQDRGTTRPRPGMQALTRPDSTSSCRRWTATRKLAGRGGRGAHRRSDRGHRRASRVLRPEARARALRGSLRRRGRGARGLRHGGAASHSRAGTPPAESVVLLQNDGVLPLDRRSFGSVAVIGPHSRRSAPAAGRLPLSGAPRDHLRAGLGIDGGRRRDRDGDQLPEAGGALRTRARSTRTT